MRIAAITMVYNEPVFLPLWLSYYGRILGHRNLFVIDHGTEDGSTDGLNANIIRLPRHHLDEHERAQSVSQMHSFLLLHYDAVLYADADEFIVADPAYNTDFVDLFKKSGHSTLASVGLDILHIRPDEADLDFSQPVLPQRTWARFNPWYCKPVISSVPITWTPGFHWISQPSSLHGNLYMLHLRSSDWRTFSDRHRVRQKITMSPQSQKLGLSRHFHLSIEKAGEDLFFDTRGTVESDEAPFDFNKPCSELVRDKDMRTSREWPTARIPDRFKSLF